MWWLKENTMWQHGTRLPCNTWLSTCGIFNPTYILGLTTNRALRKCSSETVVTGNNGIALIIELVSHQRCSAAWLHIIFFFSKWTIVQLVPAVGRCCTHVYSFIFVSSFHNFVDAQMLCNKFLIHQNIWHRKNKFEKAKKLTLSQVHS